MMQAIGALIVGMLMLASCESGQQLYEEQLIRECQQKHNVYRCKATAIPINEATDGETS